MLMPPSCVVSPYHSLAPQNSMFPRQASAVFSMGLFAPGFFYLALHQIIGFAREAPVPEWKRSLHWYFGGVMTLVGLGASMCLLLSPQGLALCDQMDRQTQGLPTMTAAKPLDNGTSSMPKGERISQGPDSKKERRASTLQARQNDQRLDVGAAVASSHPEGACGTMGRDAGMAIAGGNAVAGEDSLDHDIEALLDEQHDKNSAYSGQGTHQGRKSPSSDGSMMAVGLSIWQSLASIFASIFVIVCITSFFTVVPTSNVQLPVILFYVKNGADFAGRCASLLPFSLTDQRHLMIAVGFRCLLFPVFFVYTLSEAFGRSDVLIIMIVAVSSVSSGYINTQCYMAAAATVSSADRPMAAGLMNLVFQTSILASLGASIVLLQV